MKKTILTIVLFAAAFSGAGAQNLQSGFFLDNNVYSYRLNPAIAGERGFVGFALNNVNNTLSSNLGLSSFLYPSPDGKGLVTGLNKSVPSEKFLGRLKKVNTVNEDLSMSLLSFGFWTKHDYFHNVELNLRASANVSLPKDVFAFLKNGSQANPYDLSKLSFGAESYVEFAYGLQKTVNDKFAVGGRVKALVGFAKARAMYSKADLYVNGDGVSYDVSGKLYSAINLIGIGYKPGTFNPGKNVLDFSSISFNPRLQPSGYGAALDLGFTYKPVKDLTLSLSILDLGGMMWNYSYVGNSVGTSIFDGVNFELGSEQDIKKELDDLLDEVKKLAEFTVDGATESKMSMLAFTVNAGARYRMPFYNRLSVGVLGSYHNDTYNKWWETRVGATITPINWFSLSGNYGYGSHGWTFGAVGSLSLGFLNILFGVDSYSGKVGKYDLDMQQFLGDSFKLPFDFKVKYPVHAFNYRFNLGFTITFGARHNEFPVRVKKEKKSK